jgi:hypothetical protein
MLSGGSFGNEKPMRGSEPGHRAVSKSTRPAGRGTFFGAGCITFRRKFGAARLGAMNDDLDVIQRVLADDVATARHRR